MDKSYQQLNNIKKLNKPTVCCCITTYNSQNCITRAVNSALDQTIPFDEIIIADDASTDKTLVITKKIKTNSKIKILKNQKRFGGPAKTRNLAIKNCTSDIITFLDADDILKNNRSETIKKIFSTTGTEILVCPSIKFFEKKNKFFAMKQSEWFQNKKLNINDILNFSVGTPGSCLSFKLQTAKKLMFCEDKRCIAGEDREILIRAIIQKKIIYASKKCLFFYNKTQNNNIVNHITSPGKAEIIYSYFYLKYSNQINNYANSSFWLGWIASYLKQKKYKKGITLFYKTSMLQKIQIILFAVKRCVKHVFL